MGFNHLEKTKAENQVSLAMDTFETRGASMTRSFTNAVTDSAAGGTALSTIRYKGNALTSNYVVSGKIDIMGTGLNPHIQFGILDSGNNRILLWDNETKGAFKLCIPYDTNVPAEDIYTFKDGGCKAFVPVHGCTAENAASCAMKHTGGIGLQRFLRAVAVVP